MCILPLLPGQFRLLWFALQAVIGNPHAPWREQTFITPETGDGRHNAINFRQLFGNVANGLTSDPPMVEPIFWQAKEGHVIAMDWCEGFMQAVSLRPKEWLRLTESGTDGHLMTPIMLHRMDDAGNSVMGVPQEDLDEVLDQAAEDIPTAVAGIFDYWRNIRHGSGLSH